MGLIPTDPTHKAQHTSYHSPLHLLSSISSLDIRSCSDLFLLSCTAGRSVASHVGPRYLFCERFVFCFYAFSFLTWRLDLDFVSIGGVVRRWSSRERGRTVFVSFKRIVRLLRLWDWLARIFALVRVTFGLVLV